MKNDKLRRALALTGVILLIGMYLMTFLFAFMKSDLAAAMFRGALACTILIPVLLYAFLLMTRALRPRRSPVISTIILDVGNVLIRFNWREFAASLGMSEEDVRELSSKVVGTPLWDEIDKNTRPIEEITEELAARMPDQADCIRSLILDLDQCLIPCGYAEDWIRGLRRAGYQVLFLSNWSARAYERMKERGTMSFEDLTDGGIWSFKAHLAKPDPAIYRLLIREYDLDPARCLFIDDRDDNLAAARSVGIPAVRFTGYDEIRGELGKLGIRW